MTHTHFLQKAFKFKGLWQRNQGQWRTVGITYFSLMVGQRHRREADLDPVRALPRGTAFERKGMSLVKVNGGEVWQRNKTKGAGYWRRGPEAKAA